MQAGTLVTIVASGVQGYIAEVDTKKDLYHVYGPGFDAWYPRVALRRG